MENLTADKLIVCLGVILILLGAYNTYYSARKNYRDEQKRKAEPTSSLEERLRNHDAMLASDKRRLERLEADMKDTRDGQKYMVRGIQALLEHELHNGNSQQMQDASNDISQWLTNKI